MLNVQYLINCLNEALEENNNSLELNEKIVSKKALKRKRRKAKQAAKKAAQLDAKNLDNQQSLQKISQDDEQEQTQDNQPMQQLIVYQQPQDEISQQFKDTIKQLQDIVTEHNNQLQQAEASWKQKGDNSPCPPEVWTYFDKTINELEQKTTDIINSINTDNLSLKEAETLDIFVTALNGYIQKAKQYIISIKPNPSLQDLGNKEDEVEKIKQKTKKDKRTKQDLISFKTFKKEYAPLSKGLQKTLDGLNRLSASVAKNILPTINWITEVFTDVVWNFLVNPLSKDIIKALMYSNPFTALLLDNVNFNGLNTSMTKFKEGLKKKQQQSQFKDNHDERQLPKNVRDYTLKQLKNEFYCNKAFVTLVNTSFNHPQVRTKDKSELKRLTTTIQKDFELKDINGARKHLSQLLDTCTDICDYMDWSKPKQWNNLVVNNFIAKGNTDKEMDKINKGMKKQNTKTVSDDDYAFLQKIKALQKAQQADTVKTQTKAQESYIDIKRLNQLLEEAQG